VQKGELMALHSRKSSGDLQASAFDEVSRTAFAERSASG
jgi:hypothetical protein